MNLEQQFNKYQTVIAKVARKFYTKVHEELEDVEQDLSVVAWELVVANKAISEAYVYTALKNKMLRKMEQNNARYAVGVVGSYLTDAMSPEEQKKNEDIGSISALTVNYEMELTLHNARCVQAVQDNCKLAAKHVLNLIIDNPSVKQSDIVKTLGIPKSTVSDHVKYINTLARNYDSGISAS